MTLRQYFGCGQGREIKYSNLTFESGLNVIERLESSTEAQKTEYKKTQMPKYSIILSSPRLSTKFGQQDDFDRHIINGQHANVSLLTSMDSLKLHNSDMVHKSSHSKAVSRCSTEAVIFDMEISSSMLKKFNKHRWVIPKHSNVRFLTKQKEFFCDEFMYGRKATAVKVAEKMRSMKDNNNEKVFLPSEYLSENKFCQLLAE